MRERAFGVVDGRDAVCVCNARVAAARRVATKPISTPQNDDDDSKHSRLSREAIADVDGGDRDGA